MKQLISIEYAKLKKLKSLKIILLIYMVIVPAWMYFMGFFFTNVAKGIPLIPTNKQLYSFPGIWEFITYSASWFNLMVGVIVVIITCNEIHFRTMKQNVIDGLTKGQIILSKFIVILGISLFVTLYTALVGFLIGGFYSGFGGFYENIHYIPTYFLQTLAYFSFAFFIAVLIGRPAISIVVFILSFLVEWIIAIIISVSVSEVPSQFLPLESFAAITPNPILAPLVHKQQVAQKLWVMDSWIIYLIVLFYTLLFFFIAYRALKRRDL